MPHILLRFMAIEDENKLKISRRIATVWVFISLIVATGIGVIGLTLSKSGIIDTLTGSESGQFVKISHYLSTFNPVATFIAELSLQVFFKQPCQQQIHSFLQLHQQYHRTLQLRCYILICLRDINACCQTYSCYISYINILLLDPTSSVFKIVSFAWAGFVRVSVLWFSVYSFQESYNKYGIVSGMIAGAMISIWKFGIAGLEEYLLYMNCCQYLSSNISYY